MLMIMGWIALDIKGDKKVLSSLDCIYAQYIVNKLHDLFMFIKHQSNEKGKRKKKKENCRLYVCMF
jgi:hypothetical protein